MHGYIWGDAHHWLRSALPLSGCLSFPINFKFAQCLVHAIVPNYPHIVCGGCAGDARCVCRQFHSARTARNNCPDALSCQLFCDDLLPGHDSGCCVDYTACSSVRFCDWNLQCMSITPIRAHCMYFFCSSRYLQTGQPPSPHELKKLMLGAHAAAFMFSTVAVLFVASMGALENDSCVSPFSKPTAATSITALSLTCIANVVGLIWCESCLPLPGAVFQFDSPTARFSVVFVFWTW